VSRNPANWTACIEGPPYQKALPKSAQFPAERVSREKAVCRKQWITFIDMQYKVLYDDKYEGCALRPSQHDRSELRNAVTRIARVHLPTWLEERRGVHGYRVFRVEGKSPRS